MRLVRRRGRLGKIQHTDKKVAVHMPARMPYRVDLETSIGSILEARFGSTETADSEGGRRGSRSEGIAAATSASARALRDIVRAVQKQAWKYRDVRSVQAFGSKGLKISQNR